MLSPRLAKVMLNQYRKDNPVGVADSSRFAKYLEPKFGWGHEAWVGELASEIEKMHFDSTWNADQILRYVSKYVRQCGHESPSSVNHERKSL
jgi:hypothetical protein